MATVSNQPTDKKGQMVVHDVQIDCVHSDQGEEHPQDHVERDTLVQVQAMSEDEAQMSDRPWFGPAMGVGTRTYAGTS